MQLIKLSVPLLGLVASYSLNLSWRSCCWDMFAIYSFAKLWSSTGSRANHATVEGFSFCQRHHCIIGVKKFSGLSLASPGSAEVFHLIAKWMDLEVCIHILLLAAYGQAGDHITGIRLPFSDY